MTTSLKLLLITHYMELHPVVMHIIIIKTEFIIKKITEGGNIMNQFNPNFLCNPGRCRDNNQAKAKDYCTVSKHPKPKGILLECGTNPQDAIFNPAQTEPVTIVLDRVLVDTECLYRPLVKIEFSSLVYFNVALESPERQRSFDLVLTFELVRKCNGNEDILRTWTFRRIIVFIPIEGKIIEDWQEETPFTVTFCDKACPGCCTYEMRVTSTDINDPSSPPDFEAVNVTKPDISALAQGICGD
ncbi:MAG: DUF4489 domain-containing protein [Syntrophomonas sp.]|nr:DUF4489 domain-containing protein [Syntrophomonas sp.]